MSEDYSKMTDNELIELYHKCMHDSEQYNVSQLVKKILLNSEYGASANNYFLYYNIDMARSITLMGQCMINKSAIETNKYISKCLKESEVVDRRCYSDTDSNYFELKDVFDKFYQIKPDGTRSEATDFIDKFCKSIESNCLQPLFDKVKYETNGHPAGGMHMDREAIAIPFKESGYCGLWTAKKRYYLLIDDMEDFRYDEPHEKIMGLYSVTSACPEFVKPIFNGTLYDLVSKGPDAARKRIKEFKDEFYSKSIEEIAFPKSVSDVVRYTDPQTKLPREGVWYDSIASKERNGGVPVNSRAAIHYNWMISKLGLGKKYQTIKDGDKLKFVYLKENPYKFAVIGFKDEFPKEFDLDEYVDYDTHWEKIFYSPINDVFTACNLKIEKTMTMADFF